MFITYANQFSLTGISYIPLSLVLLYITYRYYRSFANTGKTFYRVLHYVFGIFSLVSITGALAGTLYTSRPEGIRMMLYLSSFLLSFGNAFLVLFWIREFKIRISPWAGFSTILLFGLFITILTYQNQFEPFIEASGGINWNLPVHISLLRALVYIIGIVPVIFLMFIRFQKSSHSEEKKEYLFLALLFSLFIVIVMTDFIIEPLFKMQALFSETMILMGSVAGGAAYLTTSELIITRVENQYRKLIENLNDLILIIGKDNRIIYANPALIRLLRQPASYLNNKDLSMVIHHEDLANVYQHCNPQGNKKKYKNLEFRILTNDNKLLWVETSGHFTPLKRFNNENDTLLMAFHDISERKAFETELIKAKNKAEEGERLKSAFISNIYHEIRTPMNAILGLIGVLSYNNITDEEREEFHAIVETNGQQLLKIIDDLIEIADLETKTLPMEIRECDYRNEILIAIESFAKHKKVKDKAINLLTDFGAQNLEPVILTIPQRLQQILKILLDNAIKFTHKGTITVGYDNVHKNGENYLRVYVSDSGIGIPAKHLANIFKPFYKAENPSGMFYEGTGLGLAIAVKIAALLEGFITVDSIENKGSTFSLFLKFP